MEQGDLRKTVQDRFDKATRDRKRAAKRKREQAAAVAATSAPAESPLVRWGMLGVMMDATLRRTALRLLRMQDKEKE